jgi:hypothetical protein
LRITLAGPKDSATVGSAMLSLCSSDTRRVWEVESVRCGRVAMVASAKVRGREFDCVCEVKVSSMLDIARPTSISS